MAKLLYNVIAYEATAAQWAADTNIYPVNTLMIESDTGVIKKGDGVKAYAALSTVGAKQAATWTDITDKPATFAPSAHDHAVVADEDTELEAAETLQELAEALSARIADLDGRLALIEETPAE